MIAIEFTGQGTVLQDRGRVSVLIQKFGISFENEKNKRKSFLKIKKT